MITCYNWPTKSATAMLATSSGVAQISQRLRRTESDMQDDNTPLFPLTKEIPLTQGKVAIVDAEDYERVSQYNWNAQQSKGTWYARRYGSGYMHRFILGIKDRSVLTDHADGNGLNNTRRNLRVATDTQNQINQKPSSKNKTGFKGVVVRNGIYRAQIKFNRQYFWLGTFEKAEDAARAYDKKAKELGGEFAWLNFPDDFGEPKPDQKGDAK